MSSPATESSIDLRNDFAAAAVKDRTAIETTLSKYQTALNAADTNTILTLYAPDGVFMQPYGPSAIGATAIREVYDADFAAFRLNVTFQIAEIVVMSSDWAFARTNLAGSNTINATGIHTAEANQELFVMHRVMDDQWRIARYSFSTTNPAKP